MRTETESIAGKSTEIFNELSFWIRLSLNIIEVNNIMDDISKRHTSLYILEKLNKLNVMIYY